MLYLYRTIKQTHYEKENILHIDYHFIIRWSIPNRVRVLRSNHFVLQQGYVRYHSTWGIGF